MAELCAATSLFTDLGTGQPADHALRTCVVAMRLAERLDVAPREAGDTYYVTLLRFLGCTADQHQVADDVGGDEITFFAGMAPVTMGSPGEEVRQMAALTAPGQGLARRALLVARALSDPKGKERLLGAHCEVAERLATEMGLPGEVSDALAVAYARWDGKGIPGGVAEDDIPIATRIAVVARDLELWARDIDHDTAAEVLEHRAGRAYDPSVVAAALDGPIDELRHIDGDPWNHVLDLEPGPRRSLDGSQVTRALAALGDFADLKAPEFSGHSRRTARLARAAASARGLDPSEVDTVERAALVHDLGVVAVPSGIWCAPRVLTSAEWEQVRLHPLWTRRLLSRCGGLADIAALGGSSHERLDGSGYPAGSSGGPPGWALLAAADRFDEGCSPRAYRPGARPSSMAERLAEMVSADLLPHDDVAAVLTAAGEAVPTVEVDRPAGLTEREVDVLRLLAQGRTNRQIASTLGISPKTVGAHVEHIYAKAGVASRAAATVFAMQHDLLG
jgi:HD-GYP domain-containing protein (c-di-GMP phosphodiesterase class II)/DNA-binding CsgD family transcriptional regulator